MGKRGPAPAPVELKLLKGERKDRLPKNPPKPPAGQLEAPAWLGDLALEVWAYTVEQTAAMRTATVADRDLLAAYCEAVADHRRLTVELAGAELLIVGSTGSMVANPLIARKDAAARTVKMLAAEFGLTPRARSEIELPGPSAPAGVGDIDPASLLTGGS